MKLDETMFLKYVNNRKQDYSKDLRGAFVEFSQYIHDLVRTGEVKKLSSPISAYWSITTKCNLQCNHCYASDYTNSSSIDLCLSDVRHIIETLAQNNIWELVFQGGEPFCHDSILEAIHHAKRCDLVLTILTNGTLLKGDVLRAVNSYLDDLDLLQISIDGDEIRNDNIRGKGIYYTVLNNIKNIKPKVIINCVVTSYNMESLPQLCTDLYNETNVTELHLSPLMKLGRGKNYDYPNTDHAIELFNTLKANSKIRISGAIVPDIFFLQNPKLHNIDMSHVKLGCCAGRSKIYIDHLGTVYSCDYSISSPLENPSLLQNDFLSIWNNSWGSQVEHNYTVSKRMHASGIIENYCPGLLNT